jgi:hypothetical protein
MGTMKDDGKQRVEVPLPTGGVPAPAGATESPAVPAPAPAPASQGKAGDIPK